MAMPLSMAFFIGANPIMAAPAEAARNTEPYSCKVNGRHFDPEPASIVVNISTGDVLAGEHIDELRHPASMVKMMTLALVFDALRDGHIKLDDIIEAKHSSDVQKTRPNSRSTWLDAGEKITVEEAILAIAVASSNNISVMMSEVISGSEKSFVEKMNEKAKDLGMHRTVFKNSSGLPDKAQVTTARDIAKLASYIYQQYPEYYHYFSAEKAEFGKWRGKRAKHTHNELVKDNRHIDGIKTGFICDSGYNVAVSASEHGERVIAVVFGSRTPYQRNELALTIINQVFDRIAKGKSDEEKARRLAVQDKLGPPDQKNNFRFN
jgi:D-alanyl-D-alanine carboxypeptidase